jgi:hypothetical protein
LTGKPESDAATACGVGAVVAGGREHRRRAGVVDPYPGHSTVWKCLDPDRWGTVLQGVGDGLPHRNHDVIGVVPGYPGVVSYGRVVAAPLWFLAAYLWVVLLIRSRLWRTGDRAPGWNSPETPTPAGHARRTPVRQEVPSLDILVLRWTTALRGRPGGQRRLRGSERWGAGRGGVHRRSPVRRGRL